MKPKTLHNAFPIVAAAIGNRFGIKVSVGGDQAYTDGKHIQLPAYNGDDPDYQDFAWGLLAHEAAHIRYSDFSLQYGGSVLCRRICGAIEDVRIEYLLAKDFPGTRLTLRTVVEKMITMGGFTAANPEDHPANILYSYILKSLRARVLEQSALLPLVTITESALKAHFPKGAIIRLKGLLSEVPEGLSAESDCLQLTQRILSMIAQECVAQDQRKRAASPQNPATETDVDEQDQSEQADQAEDEPLSEPEDSEESGVEENAQPNDQEASEQTLGDSLVILEHLDNATESDIDPDVFDTIKSVLSFESEQVNEVVMPIANEPTMNTLAGFNLMQKIQAESGKIRAALQGLVQAETLVRSRPSHQGLLNGKRLHRLCLGETHIFQRQSAKASPNTAIHLLLDKSESMGYPVSDTRGLAMGSRLPIALDATLALALALEGLSGVNPGITAFPGDQEGSVYRLLDHGQRVKQRSGAFSLRADGSTPMTEAIWYAAAALLRCRETRKVLMVITDGQPDELVSTLSILQRCRDSGIETVGIGLGINVSHLFPVAITINELSELRVQLFELSKSILIAA